MAAKDQFLQLHLAGFRNFAQGFVPSSGKSNPSYMFVKRRYHSGHIFLQEDALMEPALFVVLDGSVDFLRTAPRRMLAAASPRHSQVSSPRSKMWRATSSAPPQKSPCSLLSGGVFASAQVTSANQPETFTVSAGAHGCEVCECSGENFQKLPPRVLSQVQEHLLHASGVRLARFENIIALDEHLPQNVQSPATSLSPRKTKKSTLTALLPEAGHQNQTLGGAEQAKQSKFKADRVLVVAAKSLTTKSLRDSSYWFI